MKIMINNEDHPVEFSNDKVTDAHWVTITIGGQESTVDIKELMSAIIAFDAYNSKITRECDCEF